MQIKIKHVLMLTIASLFVTACGGGSSDSDSGSTEAPSSSILTIEAMNVSNSLNVTQATTMSLDSKVLTSDDKAAYIKSIVPLNTYTQENCISDHSSLNLTIRSSKLGVCTYQYTAALAEDPSVTSTAINFSAVQSASGGSYLSVRPISLAMNMGDNELVDLEDELGTDYSSAMVLDADSITIVGDQDTVVTPDTTNNTLDIIAGSTAGHTRVYYTMTDTTLETVTQGVIDIAVSNNINFAPEAEDYNHPTTLDSKATFILDLEDLGIISDADGDELKLTDVFTVNAQASLLDDSDENYTKTSFLFTGNGGIGERVVTYVVTDQNGGYAIGRLYFNLTGGIGEITISWDDIIIQETGSNDDGETVNYDMLFTSPLSKDFASFMNVSHSGEYVEEADTGPAGFSIVLMTFQEAHDFCEYKGGRLPTSDELSQLNKEEGNINDEHSWPTGEVYWAADGYSKTEAVTYDFTRSSTSSYADGFLETASGLANVTCLMFDEANIIKDFSIDRLSEDSRVNYTTEYSTTVYYPDGTTVAPYMPVHISTQDGNGVFTSDDQVDQLDIIIKSDESGQVSFTYTDINKQDDIIVSQFSSNEFNTIYKTDSEFKTSWIDVTDDNLWSRIALDSTDPLNLDQSNGLPLMNADSSYAYKSSNIYAIPFNALEWEIYFVTQATEKTNGTYTLFVTQTGPTPSEDWGDADFKYGSVPVAGAPDGDDALVTYSFGVHRSGTYTGAGMYHEDGTIDYYKYTGSLSDIIQTTEPVYHWAGREIQQDGRRYVYYYVGASPDKSEAMLIYSYYADSITINPYNDSYIGFGGERSSGDVGVTLLEAHVSTFSQ